MFQTRLRELREANGFRSQQAFADAFGVAQSTVGGWEAGKREPNFTTMQKLADFFNVSIDYLLGRSNYLDAPHSTGGVWIPVLGRVAAGVPIEAIEDVEDYEEITMEMAEAGEHFALKIKGDSMEPKISNGDVVIVRCQADCDSGSIAVVIVNGQDATVQIPPSPPHKKTLCPQWIQGFSLYCNKFRCFNRVSFFYTDSKIMHKTYCNLS